MLSEVILKNAALAHSSSTEGFPLMFGAGMEQDDVLYVNTDGIYTHSMGGSVSEQLVSGELSSLKAGEMQFVSLVMAGEKDILLHAVGSEGDKVLRYHYDESVPAVPEKELKVYALRDSSLLRQGILLYQKQNQDVFVNLQIGVTEEDGVTAEDAVKALNTAASGRKCSGCAGFGWTSDRQLYRKRNFGGHQRGSRYDQCTGRCF